MQNSSVRFTLSSHSVSKGSVGMTTQALMYRKPHDIEVVSKKSGINCYICDREWRVRWRNRAWGRKWTPGWALKLGRRRVQWRRTGVGGSFPSAVPWYGCYGCVRAAHMCFRAGGDERGSQQMDTHRRARNTPTGLRSPAQRCFPSHTSRGWTGTTMWLWQILWHAMWLCFIPPTFDFCVCVANGQHLFKHRGGGRGQRSNRLNGLELFSQVNVFKGLDTVLSPCTAFKSTGNITKCLFSDNWML